MKNQRGITLISLVITIVVLIILAGVAINMTLGENGIFKKAQEAKRLREIATAKEQIGLEILEAQIEAMENNEELEQSEVETIVAKYGELQADGDTIILNDSGYEVSLREIYNEMAEAETDGDSTTELAQLKALLAQTTVTEDKILKDYKAYKDGQLITGTMENYAGQTVEASTIEESGENAEITIPQAGYYDTTSKISVPVSEINSNSGSDSMFELVTTNTSYTFPDDGIYLITAHGIAGAVYSDGAGGLSSKLTITTDATLFEINNSSRTQRDSSSNGAGGGGASHMYVGMVKSSKNKTITIKHAAAYAGNFGVKIFKML